MPSIELEEAVVKFNKTFIKQFLKKYIFWWQNYKFHGKFCLHITLVFRFWGKREKKGSKNYKMSHVEVNFVKVEILKENGERKYDRDLWIEVVGKKKDEISPRDVYLHYKNRFDIEHFAT